MTHCLFKNTFVHLLWILCLFSVAPAQTLSEVTTPSPSPTTAGVNLTSDYCAFIGGSFQLVASLHNIPQLTYRSFVEWTGLCTETNINVRIVLDVTDCSVQAIYGDDITRYSVECDSTNDIYTMQINQVEERDIYTSWRFRVYLPYNDVYSDPKSVLFCDVNLTSEYCAFIGGSFQLVATVYNAKLLYRVDWKGLNPEAIFYVRIYVEGTDCSVSNIYGDDISRYSIECDSDNDVYTFKMRINQVEEKDLYTSWTVRSSTSHGSVVSDPKPVLFCGNVISIGKNIESYNNEGATYNLSLAVDGNISTDYLTCDCCANLYSTFRAWLRLDLGHTYRISRIILYGLKFYVRSMSFRLDSDVVHTTSEIIDPNYFLDLNITSDHVARNVSITFVVIASDLAICELLVFKGCADYFYGVNCTRQCHCDGSTCNILSGKCPSGRCQAGYSGETCSEYNSTTLSSPHITDATAVTSSFNTATTREMTTTQRNSSTVTSNRTDSPWTSMTTQTETETQMTSTTPETTDTTPTLSTQTSASPSSYPSSAIASASSSTRTTSPSTTVTPVPSTSSTSFSTYGTSESPTSATLPPTTTLENSQESTSLNISTSHRSSPSTESSSVTTSTLSYSTDDNMTHTATYAITDTNPIVDVNLTSDYCAFIGGSFRLVATVYNAKLIYSVNWIGLDAGTITNVIIAVDVSDCSVYGITDDDRSRYSFDCDSDNDVYTYTMRINQVEEKDLYTSWRVQVYTSQDAAIYDPKPVLFCGNVISIGVNIESSQYASTYYPSFAVDGNISTNYSACLCCTHLYGLLETWLRLDLGHTYKISRVILYGGTDFPYDFSGMIIRLDSDAVYAISNLDWTGFLDLNMTSDRTARNVLITFDQSVGAVAICELLVFKGCDDYFFGVNCASQCHCDGSPCNILSGKCPSGRCQAGFSGETCSEYDYTTSTTPYPTTSTKPAVDCGVPKEIENGLANYTNTTVGSTASYTCSPGYNMIGNNVTICKEDGQWLGIPPYCEIIDCGPPPNLTNGVFSLVGGTTYSSIALYSCNGRFKLNSTTNKRTCLANGSWFGDIGVCIPIACMRLPVPSDGAVSYTNNGNTAHFNCTPGFSLIGSDRLICLLSGSWSGQVPKCQRFQIEIQDCPKESDRQNTLWNYTKAGQTVTVDCPEGQEGIISRHCTVEGFWRLPRYTCVSAEISAAESTIDAIASTNVTEAVKSGAVTDVLGTLSNSTTESTAMQNSAMLDGEIEKVTAILEKVASLSQDIIVTPKQSEDFIGTTSNLLNPGNSESFKSLEENKDESPVAGADKVLKVVGTFAKAMANSIDNLNGSKTITSDNLVLTVARLDSTNDIQFPEQSMDSLTGAHVPHNFLGGGGSYSGILYHNLSGLLPPRLEDNGNKDEDNFQINGPVMDMQLLNTTSTPSFQITLSFENFQSGEYDSRCTFWNYNKSLWDTFGCFLNEDKTTSYVTVCTCNHTTNFAILMNPSTTPNVDTKAIDYITIIGCSISFICLIITIVMYKILWRYLRSDRAVILMNLSVALILAYAVFIAGVDRTEYRAVCTGVAIALHYIYLVVFLLMLSEGIEIFITVVYVFIVKSRLRRLIGLSWGLPVIVVGISVGVTRTEGYGSNESCWLSSDGGLIWAFLGPALAVLLANYVLLAIVIKTMFKAKTLKQRSITEQVKTGIRCLCVLLPLTGCTWVIGVFYVNEGLAWTQYLFAVLNSLQGVVIMVFQCIFNSQMRLAISRRMGAYRASTAFTKPSNNQPRSSDGSSSYQGRFSSDTYNEELTEDYDRSLQNLHFNNIRTPASRHSDPHSTSVM